MSVKIPLRIDRVFPQESENGTFYKVQCTGYRPANETEPGENVRRALTDLITDDALPDTDAATLIDEIVTKLVNAGIDTSVDDTDETAIFAGQQVSFNVNPNSPEHGNIAKAIVEAVRLRDGTRGPHVYPPEQRRWTLYSRDLGTLNEFTRKNGQKASEVRIFVEWDMPIAMGPPPKPTVDAKTNEVLSFFLAAAEQSEPTTPAKKKRIRFSPENEAVPLKTDDDSEVF